LEGQKGNNVREHDGYENLSPQTIPAGAFSRLRLALFDRIERNPWVFSARDHPRSNLSARVIALAGIPLLDRKKFSGEPINCSAIMKFRML